MLNNGNAMRAGAQFALARLLEGNRHYQSGMGNSADLSIQHRQQAAHTHQAPYAAVVACSDSRVPVEHIFSAGIGEVFVIRTAGNTVGSLEIGSLEYALTELGVPLVMVLGHTGCGAVQAGMQSEMLTNPVVQEIISAIQGHHNAKDCEWLNVQNSVAKIRQSPVVIRLEQQGEACVLGAMYNMVTGAVEFIGAVSETIPL